VGVIDVGEPSIASGVGVDVAGMSVFVGTEITLSCVGSGAVVGDCSVGWLVGIGLEDAAASGPGTEDVSGTGDASIGVSAACASVGAAGTVRSTGVGTSCACKLVGLWKNSQLANITKHKPMMMT
jgi:hypothetical protein